jgi:hypothetical protein
LPNVHSYETIETALKTILQPSRNNLIGQISFSFAANIEIANKKSG